MKLGIHTSDWNKVIEAIREEIPQPYADIVIRILEKLATQYF